VFSLSKAADLPGPLLLNFVKAAQASLRPVGFLPHPIYKAERMLLYAKRTLTSPVSAY